MTSLLFLQFTLPILTGKIAVEYLCQILESMSNCFIQSGGQKTCIQAFQETFLWDSSIPFFPQPFYTFFSFTHEFKRTLINHLPQPDLMQRTGEKY